MKITFVLPGFSPRPVGGFRVVYEYCNRLVDRGHEATIVHLCHLSDKPPSLYRRLRSEAGLLRRLIFKPNLWWQAMDKRVQMLHIPPWMSWRIPDGNVVFATAWQTAEHVLGYPASKGQKFYLVMDFGSWFGPKDQLEATWRWPLKKVTISRWLYEQVCSCGVPPSDAANIPIGIDHSSFHLTTDVAARPKRVAMLYGFSDYKAPRDGLAALEIAMARNPDLQVLVFGPFRRPKGLLPSFVYKQNIPEAELIEVYNSSRVFVCSSIAEGFALPPAEAMACGCAVASTDCGGIREYAEHEVNALLSPPGDPQALAESIARLLEDESLRQKIAIAGRARIKEFTWERSTDLLEEFMNQETTIARLC